MSEKSPTSDQNSPQRNYKIEMPSYEYALASMQKFLGEKEAQALWGRTCKAAGFSPDHPDHEALERAFQVLSKETGPIGVLGRSLSIRITSCRLIQERQHKGSHS